MPDSFYRGNDEETILTELTKYAYDTQKNEIVLNDSLRIPVEVDLYDYEIGGYKPIQKWLKDRKGFSFARADYNCLCHIILAMQETRKVVAKIDEVIRINA